MTPQSPFAHLFTDGDFISDEDAEALLARFEAENPQLMDDAQADEPVPFILTADARTALHLNDPLAAHDAWQQRLASGDPYALEVSIACELWQMDQDVKRSQRELRRLRREYKAALSRNDSTGASRVWHSIQRLEAARRAARQAQV